MTESETLTNAIKSLERAEKALADANKQKYLNFKSKLKQRCS